MTKNEFCREAGKAGINPNLYGVTIDVPLSTRERVLVSKGKVVGIAWFNEWKTEKEYRPGLGKWDSTFLSKVPYVVLRKDKSIYHVAAGDISAYLQQILDEQLIAMAKGKTKIGSPRG